MQGCSLQHCHKATFCEQLNKVIDALGSQGGEGQAAVTIPFQDVSYTPTRALYETDALQVLSCSVLASQETVADVFAAHIQKKKKKKESDIQMGRP